MCEKFVKLNIYEDTYLPVLSVQGKVCLHFRYFQQNNGPQMFPPESPESVTVLPHVAGHSSEHRP
jgi:hypothetical protein